MRNKRIVFYTIYKIVDDDLKLIMQVDKIKELGNIFNKSNDYINLCINKGILINDRYIIKKDYILESEFWEFAFFNEEK